MKRATSLDMTMPKRSRFRRILKWGAMIWCIVLLVVWGLSPWMRVVYTWNDLIFVLEGGRLIVFTVIADPGADPKLVASWITEYGEFFSQWLAIAGQGIREGLAWFPRKKFLYEAHNSKGMTLYYVNLPFWLLLSTSLLPTGFLFWRDRRRRIPPGHCQRCGYNLTGNVSGICSECGEPCEPDERAT